MFKILKSGDRNVLKSGVMRVVCQKLWEAYVLKQVILRLVLYALLLLAACLLIDVPQEVFLGKTITAGW